MHTGSSELLNLYKKGIRAFTLIEMLIVVSIIAILAALLMPALHSSIEQARVLSCSSNLKQVGVAIQMYNSDNPPYVLVAQWRNNANWSGTWVQWAGILNGTGYFDAPRAKNNDAPMSAASILHCPTGRTDAFASSPSSLDDPNIYRPYKSLIAHLPSGIQERNLHVWYSMNAGSGVSSRPSWRVAPDNDRTNWKRLPKLSRITSPSATICMYDGPIPVNPNAYRISRRHNGGNSLNMLFWDSHVQTIGAGDVPMPGVSWSRTSLNNWNPDIKWYVNQ